MIYILAPVALGLGTAAVWRLRNPEWTPMQLVLIAWGVGLGLCGYTVFVLGLIGALSGIGFGVAGVVLAAPATLGLVLLAKRVNTVEVSLPGGTSAVAMLVLILLSGAWALVSAMIMPGAHEWDSLSYHLAAPRQWLLQHTIAELPTDHHSYFPFLTQMLYTLCLIWDEVSSAKLVHWSCGVATCCATYAMCRRWMSRHAALWAATCVAITPFIVWEAGTAYIELAQAFYVVMALYMTLSYRRSHHLSDAAVAGAFAGLALAVKTLSVIPVAAIAAVLLLARPSLRHLAAYFAALLVLGAPFYVRTYVLTGNPVYPFAYSLFGGKYWDAKRAEAYSGEQRSYGLDGQLTRVGDDLLPSRKPYKQPTGTDRVRNVVLAPFSLVAIPRLFHNYNDPGPLFTLGFLAIIAIPIGALAWRSPVEHRILLAVLAFWLIAWSLTMQYARYLIPAVPVAAAVGAYGVETLSAAYRWLRHLVTVATLTQGAVLISVLLPQVPSLIGALNEPDAYLERSVNIYRSCQWINANTDAQSGVVLFEETRGFYLKRRVLWGNTPHSTYIPYERFRTHRDMVRWFLDHGVKYALVNLQFAPQAATQAGAYQLRIAVLNGTLPDLFREWYAHAGQFGEPWRPFLAQAVSRQDAFIEDEACQNATVVIRFGFSR